MYYTRRRNYLGINGVLDVTDVTTESTVAAEPVTTQEFKDYMRLEGFIDDDESTASVLSEFDLEDTLIDELLKDSRIKLEEVSGISFKPKTIEAIVYNEKGMQQIKPGPVGDIIEILDANGTEIVAANYVIVGNLFKWIQSPRLANMKITFESGYGTTGLPELDEGKKKDIMRLAAFMYDNRKSDEVHEFALKLVRGYTKNGLL